MLKLYHAPRSRSSRIVSLIHELGAGNDIEIVPVTVPRIDGTGGPDPANPHPEKKVPLLMNGSELIRETVAITQYLTDLYCEAGMAPAPGAPQRGTYLSWLAYYAGVVEPVMVMKVAGLTHPVIDVTFRGEAEMVARLAEALEDRPYLLGDQYSAADLILASPFAWMPDATPDVACIRDWVARTQDREAVRRTAEQDAAWLEAA
ncbi:glutathione S-transferase family protein [Algicella marina]|uniref:Glutathione S-transferase n=1 Tax=Algicella marina TaxID=2683284 RepID=A0A6P1T2G2_9RHOB|nr:glutathione S-transferase family protein [Algicella marina]QHQ35911.1 glutathione S-transferase [Algicella marina]